MCGRVGQDYVADSPGRVEAHRAGDPFPDVAGEQDEKLGAHGSSILSRDLNPMLWFQSCKGIVKIVALANQTNETLSRSACNMTLTRGTFASTAGSLKP
jgi:hypothetical protein